MKSSLMNWKRLKLREIRNPDIEASINNVFEDNSTECERQGRYDKIICKLRKQKKKREYISKKENIDYFIMIKALAKSTHFQ